MKKGIIISTLGKQTFNEQQIKRLQASMDVNFHAQKEPFNESEFIKLVQPYQFVAINRRSIKDLGVDILEQLHNLNALAIFSTGYEWVDTNYLKQKDIKVSYLPEYSTISVAEHTIALLLMALRRTHLTYDYSRDLIGNTISMRGYELQGKKIGIIGFGRIGQKVTSMLQSFNVNIKYYDIDEQKNKIDIHKFEDRNILIETSDIIIICASKKRGAESIIQKLDISNMKNGVIIINSARADLVDNEAIISGIQSKKIFTYAVDEKVPLFRKVAIEKGRIIETAHTAWYSTEAIARGVDQWVENIIGLATKKYKNIL